MSCLSDGRGKLIQKISYAPLQQISAFEEQLVGYWWIVYDLCLGLGQGTSINLFLCIHLLDSLKSSL